MLERMKRGRGLGPSKPGRLRRRLLLPVLLLLFLATGVYSWLRSSKTVALLPGTWVNADPSGDRQEWLFSADGSLTRTFELKDYRVTCSNEWHIVGNRLLCSSQLPGTSSARALWNEIVSYSRGGNLERYRVLNVDERSLLLEPE